MVVRATGLRQPFLRLYLKFRVPMWQRVAKRGECVASVECGCCPKRMRGVCRARIPPPQKKSGAPETGAPRGVSCRVRPANAGRPRYRMSDA
ncbi:protein of unknown function [Burkholderia multivorans]